MKYQIKFTITAKDQNEAREKFWELLNDFEIEPEDFLAVKEETDPLHKVYQGRIVSR